MNIDKLKNALESFGEPVYRAKQIRQAVFQDGAENFLQVLTLPLELRKKLSQTINFLSFEVEKVLDSRDACSFKALLKLSDNVQIETVLISPKPGHWTACISCQTGCLLGCAFCATGKIKKMRNLSAEEITDQVLFWNQFLKKKSAGHKLNNIVYMGMGEPFLNWVEVSQSLANLISPEIFNFRSRAITVSTSGVAEGIVQLASKFPQVNLAISLHSADQETREKLMPIAKKYPLERIAYELKKYFQKCRRKVFIEYMLLEKINDSEIDAEKLSRWIDMIGVRHLLHVNLITYNQTDSGFLPSSPDRTRKFKNYLLRRKIMVTIRKSLGQEIEGACGQLSQKGKIK